MSRLSNTCLQILDFNLVFLKLSLWMNQDMPFQNWNYGLYSLSMFIILVSHNVLFRLKSFTAEVTWNFLFCVYCLICLLVMSLIIVGSTPFSTDIAWKVSISIFSSIIVFIVLYVFWKFSIFFLLNLVSLLKKFYLCTFIAIFLYILI